jgi:hypothetical protein
MPSLETNGTTEPEGGGYDPAVSVMFALAEGTADALAVDTEAGIPGSPNKRADLRPIPTSIPTTECASADALDGVDGKALVNSLGGAFRQQIRQVSASGNDGVSTRRTPEGAPHFGSEACLSLKLVELEVEDLDRIAREPASPISE